MTKIFLLIVLTGLLCLRAGVGAAGEAAWERYNQAGVSAYQRGDYAEATKQFEAALKEAQDFGEQDPRLATSLNNLAGLYYFQGRYGETEPLFKRALAIYEKALGPEHPQVAESLNNLAVLYYGQGRYGEAEPLYKRALAIYEKALGPEHPHVATSLNNLAGLYYFQGRYGEAEPLYKRALAIREKALGPEHPHVAESLNNLAALYDDQGRYGEAKPLFKRALAIREKALGPEHPQVAESLNNLAVLYYGQGRYGEAEPLYKRALAIYEKALGPEHPHVATSLNNLAALYRAQGHYGEAEPLYKRALAIREKALGPEHPHVATSLNNLAALYDDQGRYGDAEPLYKRALASAEKALGPAHPDVAGSLNNLAGLYYFQGRYGEAEPLYKRALAIYEKALGPAHPQVAGSLNNLAEFYRAQGRYGEAEPLFKRALAIREKALGPAHPDVALSLNNLAELYYSQGRYGEAEPLHKRALAIKEKVLGPEHPDVALSLNNLAELYYSQGRYGEALPFIRKATAILRTRASLASGERSSSRLSEQRTRRPGFVGHVSLLSAVAGKKPDERLGSEAFEVAQLARASDTAQAVARMAARFASGNNEFAGLARTRQDALQRWQFVDAELLKAVGKPTGERSADREARLREELSGLDKRIAELDTTLQRTFPEYKDLTSPEPLVMQEAQKLLAPQEALLAYLVGEKESYLWLVRKAKSDFRRIEIGKQALDKVIKVLRLQLDASSGVRPFAVKKAHELYRRIFAPAEPLLKDATHVIVVPDGALQSLPFGVLVIEEPKAPISSLSQYRDIAWLAEKYALTVLPSESSLRALRRFAKGTLGDQPFTGFGDPVLKGGGQTRGANVATLFSRGAIADVNEVRQLPRLQETADELYAMAGALGADKRHIHLRQAATETNVKRLDFTPYHILAFSTHGLMAGEFKGLAEPALVLTPPKKGTELDDGLLTASEVAQLKLNADWVILSACNTAAADGTPGAEGLSGLARAFFYAGSRALLVSHWMVASDATVELATGMLKEAAANPGIGRSETLRRSMLALMRNQDKPYYAHPALWAPFVVVGEGGGVSTR